MYELTLTLSDELYARLRDKALNRGLPLERLIVEQLATEPIAVERQDEATFLHEALVSSGLLESISADLIATYVSDPTAPRHSPVRIQGKPLSVVISEQRAAVR